MQVKMTRYSASAGAVLLLGGVLFVRLAGPLTGPALMFFKAGIATRYPSGVLAIVADYRQAAVALGGAELDAVLDGEAEGSTPAMSAALIVRPECIGLFRGHALRMAGAHGVTRRVFVEAAPAIAWAQGLAERRRA